MWPAVAVRLFADGERIAFDTIQDASAPEASNPRYLLKAEGTETVQFLLRRRDGRRMGVDHLEIEFTVPLLNFSKVVLPDAGREYLFRDRALFLRSQVSQISAANAGHPFAALVDQTGGKVYAFGLVSWLRESTCRCVEPQCQARSKLQSPIAQTQNTPCHP